MSIVNKSSKVKPIKVMFFGYWATPKELLENVFNIFTPGGDGVWNNIIGVSNINEADYYVIFDAGHRQYQNLDPSKTIYIKLEPPGCLTGWMRGLKLPLDQYFFSGTYDKIHIPAFPWINKTYAFLKDFKYTPRTKSLVAICSGKTITPIHKKRLELLRKIASSGIEIDIYGKGLNRAHFGSCYKGELRGKCKFDCLTQYKCALVCENFMHENHMTEKIYDSFLCMTYPIYAGCTNIKEYYDSKSYTSFDLNDVDSVISKIKSITSQTFTQDTINALVDSKNRTLDCYTIWPTVEKILINKNKL